MVSSVGCRCPLVNPDNGLFGYIEATRKTTQPQHNRARYLYLWLYARWQSSLEMELFVKAGDPIYQTLRSITILPAKTLGKEANILILAKKPLENKTHIRSLDWIYCNEFLVKGKGTF